ncbi:MAG: hypothetical protein AAFR52_01355 [Pseudomonadota bacterium]
MLEAAVLIDAAIEDADRGRHRLRIFASAAPQIGFAASYEPQEAPDQAGSAGDGRSPGDAWPVFTAALAQVGEPLAACIGTHDPTRGHADTEDAARARVARAAYRGLIARAGLMTITEEGH